MDTLFQLGYDTIPEVGIFPYKEVVWIDSLNQTRMWHGQTGINNSYYITNIPNCLEITGRTNLNQHLSVIKYPNRKRKACQFVPDSVYFGTIGYTKTTLPNFPNYHLGPTATPCNVTTRDIWLKHSGGIKIYPNPVYRACSLETAQDVQGQVQLFNISGQLQYETTHSGGKQLIELPNLPSGIYFVRLLVEGGGVLSQKVRVE
jgi:hypothetical protein